MPRRWRGHPFDLAERAGFEPAIPFRVYTLSRRAPSTTRTPLLITRAKPHYGPSRGPQKYKIPPYLPNNFSAFAVVTAATSSTETPFTSASLATTYLRYAGSFRLPRYGTGARYGASVSSTICSNGISRKTSGKRRILIRQHPADPQIKTQIHDRPRIVRPAAKTMEHPPARPAARCPRTTPILSFIESREWITIGKRYCTAHSIW